MTLPKHGRRLVLGGHALVPGRVRFAAQAAGEVRDELEKVLTSSDFFGNAPFDWITLIIRYGTCYGDADIEVVNEKYGDLPVSIEIPMSDLQRASEEATRNKFREATLRALIQVGVRFGLCVDKLEELT